MAPVRYVAHYSESYIPFRMCACLRKSLQQDELKKLIVVCDTLDTQTTEAIVTVIRLRSLRRRHPLNSPSPIPSATATVSPPRTSAGLSLSERYSKASLRQSSPSACSSYAAPIKARSQSYKTRIDTVPHQMPQTQEHSQLIQRSCRAWSIHRDKKGALRRLGAEHTQVWIIGPFCHQRRR